jgi:hypothetical protein
MNELTRTVRTALPVAAVIVVTFASLAEAQVPTLTPAGQSLGFELDTIVSNLPTNNGRSFDVLGSAINSDGNIILNASQNTGGAGNYVFHDLNNQSAANAISFVPFSGFASALAFSNGSVWASALGGNLVRLNNDGSINTVYNGTGGNPNITANQGLWTNPANGHLIAGNPLFDINVSGPVPVQTLLTSNFSADGIAVSPDGRFVYGSGGTIVDLTNPNGPHGSFGFVSGADGMGVISAPGSVLDGDIIVNTTTGNIVLVDHTTFAQTIIASGGGYGDYTSPDRNDGSLLVSSSNNLLRLSCGPDCAIGSTPPSVPEPSTWAMMLLGFAGLGFAFRRSRRRVSMA